MPVGRRPGVSLLPALAGCADHLRGAYPRHPRGSPAIGTNG